MAAIISDLMVALETHLADNVVGLTASEIAIKWPDDRTTGTTNDVASNRVTLSVVGFVLDIPNNYSGKTYEVVKDDDAISAFIADPDTAPIPSAALNRIPLPFEITIQIDTYDEKLFKSWELQEGIAPLLASRMKFTTAAGTTYEPFPEPGDDGDNLAPLGFLKVFRFSVQAWIDDPHNESAWLITETRYDINGETLIKSHE